MASTFSNVGIELIATGEQSGTWGSTTNTNLQIIDRLTNGVGAISLTGTTHTLTTTNTGSASLSDGQYAVLVFGGTPSGTNTVTISPDSIQHVYIVKNSSGQSIVLTQGSGGNVTVADGDTKIVYCDGAGAGAAVVDITADFAMSNVAITGGSITGITDLAVADGGTGVSTVPTNGQILIGNGTGYTVATLTAGAGASISNGSGSITISATGAGGTVTSVGGTGTVNGLTLTGTVTTTGNLTLGGTLAISDADWSGTDLSVANGGTGASSFTANNVLLGNGTSSFQTVAPGTTGNVLTSNGTTWTSAAPSAGALEYISSGTASNSADLTFTLTSGYDGFLLKLENILPATDNTTLYAKIGSSNHEWTILRASTTNVVATTGTSDSSGASLALTVGNAAGSPNEEGVSGNLTVDANYENSAVNTTGKASLLHQQSSNILFSSFVAFQTLTAAADTSIVFSFSSGNITSGTITMYGYVAS